MSQSVDSDSCGDVVFSGVDCTNLSYRIGLHGISEHACTMQGADFMDKGQTVASIPRKLVWLGLRFVDAFLGFWAKNPSL
jgi:hypothetical protein